MLSQRLPKQILIIDDDEDLCQEIAEALRGNDYSVKSTSDPHEGKVFIDKYPFDVAFVDYKMQDLNGIDMLRIIKRKNHNTKVFIMSGRPFIKDLIEEENVANLVDGIIKKPFQEQDLLNKIENLPS